jgi:peptide chain release factor 2
LAVLRELADEEESAETRREVEAGLADLEPRLRALELRSMLSGPNDHRDVYLSIHAGAGGTESCDWAQMLLRMYLRWIEEHGFEAAIIDEVPGEQAGLRSVTLEVTGQMAHGYLRAEIGVHRLVRISPFDAAARRHTSFASLDVVPKFEDDDIQIEINDKDLRVDTYRSSGPGGQNVNKVSSAVRITHLPTGIVVACQIDRSQHRNRATAMSILKSRLYRMEEQKRNDELAKLYGDKGEIAWGNQIRSYVLQPYTMVKDHRTGVETANVQAVLDGDLDAFIEAYLKAHIGEAEAAKKG